MPTFRDIMKDTMDNTTPAQSGDTTHPSVSQPVDSNAPQSSSVRSTYGKEQEAIPSQLNELGVTDHTKEAPLPPDVAQAGVRTTPTSVTLPKPVASLGVQPSSATQPVSNGASVTLPLTDEQIAEGVKLGVTDSVRWLAEWCRRHILRMRRKDAR